MADITNETLNQILNSIEQYRGDLVVKLNETGAQVPSNATLYEALQKVSGQSQPGVQAIAGYIVNQNGKLVFKSLEDSSSLSISSLYVPDTPAQPQYEAGGQIANADFYRCSYVNSDSWGGYKAILSNGVYTFDQTVTRGLTYAQIVPTAGQLYVDGALIRAAEIYTGLPTNPALYLSMERDTNTAETGQIATRVGTISTVYDSELGRNVWSVTGNVDHYVYFGGLNLPQFTISFWAKRTDIEDTVHYGLVGIGDQNAGPQFMCSPNNVHFYRSNWSDYMQIPNVDCTKWVFYCWTYDGSMSFIYANGTNQYASQNKQPSYTLNGSNSLDIFQLIAHTDSRSRSCKMASFRVFGRVLSSNQIAALANQFTPTA